MRILRALAASALAIAAPVSAQVTAITGGTVVIGDGSAPIENGTVVVSGNRVVAAGANVSIPPNATRVDASGKWVTPGMVAGFSRVGLVEVGAVSQTNDINASDSDFSAALDVQYAINPFSSPISVSRAHGLTRAVVAPSTSSGFIFAGQGAVIDLGQDASPITQAKAFQYVELGETGSARAGGSRMASHVLFRALLDEAQRYARSPATFESEMLTVSDAKALLPVLRGSTRLLVGTESANDILQVLKLKREYPALKLVLVGASEGWRVAREIAAANVPVIAQALNDLPYQFETLAATQSNVGRMKDAGVRVALGDGDAHQLRYAPQNAGNLVALNRVPGATGLSWGEAFATISSVPADIMGLGSRIGSLRPGRAADIVIWSGDPLELSSHVERVWIDGVSQNLSNRQERLRERYRSPSEGALPKAYDR